MILFNYVLKELVFPLILAVCVISSILLMDQVYKFIPFVKASGVQLTVLLQMMLYSLPTILMISTPISLMIGVYVGIHRASADSEIIAMRASGVSLSFLLKPVLVLSMIISVFVLIQTFYLSPIGVSKMEELKFNILKNQTRLQITVKKVNNFFDQKMIYIFDKEEDVYKGIFITDWNAGSSKPVIEAKSGIINFNEEDKKVYFIMSQGKIHYPQKNGSYRVVEFERLKYNLNPPKTTSGDLPKRFQDQEGKRSKMDIEMTQDELLEQINLSKDNPKAFLEYTDEFHGRIVTVLSCMSFALFALPIGIIDPRNPKTAKFIWMILMMIVYYSMFSKARSMLTNGQAYPASLYFPLALAIFIGYINFYKINHDLSSFREWFQIKVLNKTP